jgi:ribonuclease PH
MQADGGELAAAICAASAALADAAIEQTDMLPACAVVSGKDCSLTVFDRSILTVFDQYTEPTIGSCTNIQR